MCRPTKILSRGHDFHNNCRSTRSVQVYMQVLEILESPSISKKKFSSLESPGILVHALESLGNLKWATFFVEISALKF